MSEKRRGGWDGDGGMEGRREGRGGEKTTGGERGEGKEVRRGKGAKRREEKGEEGKRREEERGGEERYFLEIHVFTGQYMGLISKKATLDLSMSQMPMCSRRHERSLCKLAAFLFR